MASVPTTSTSPVAQSRPLFTRYGKRSSRLSELLSQSDFDDEGDLFSNEKQEMKTEASWKFPEQPARIFQTVGEIREKTKGGLEKDRAGEGEDDGEGKGNEVFWITSEDDALENSSDNSSNGLFSRFANSWLKLLQGSVSFADVAVEFEALTREGSYQLSEVASRLVHVALQERFVRQRASLLQQESSTWNLLLHVFGAHLRASPESALENDEASSHLEDVCSRFLPFPSPLEARLFVSRSPSLLLSHLILQWLEQGAAREMERERERGNFLGLHAEESGVWRHTMLLKKREKEEKRRERGGNQIVSFGANSSYRTEREGEINFLEASSGGVKLVRHLDPDAVTREGEREGRRIHPEDEASDERLFFDLWRLIRAGKLKEAKLLCRNAGQSWRAASIDGALDFSDDSLKDSAQRRVERKRLNSNVSEFFGNFNEKGRRGGEGENEREKAREIGRLREYQSAEMDFGRGRRHQLWKWTCFQIASKSSSLYESAIYASLCSHTRIALHVAEDWETALWVLTKSFLDVQVDLELRKRQSEYLSSLKVKSLLVSNSSSSSAKRKGVENKEAQLAAYDWPTPVSGANRKVASFADVIHLISTSELVSEKVRKSAKEPFRVLQAEILLRPFDPITELLRTWVAPSPVSNKPSCDDQVLRFAAHFVLFLRQIASVNSQREREKQLRAEPTHALGTLDEFYAQKALFVSRSAGDSVIYTYCFLLLSHHKETFVAMYSRHLSSYLSQNLSFHLLDMRKDASLSIRQSILLSFFRFLPPLHSEHSLFASIKRLIDFGRESWTSYAFADVSRSPSQWESATSANWIRRESSLHWLCAFPDFSTLSKTVAFRRALDSVNVFEEGENARDTESERERRVGSAGDEEWESGSESEEHMEVEGGEGEGWSGEIKGESKRGKKREELREESREILSTFCTFGVQQCNVLLREFALASCTHYSSVGISRFYETKEISRNAVTSRALTDVAFADVGADVTSRNADVSDEVIHSLLRDYATLETPDEEEIGKKGWVKDGGERWAEGERRSFAPLNHAQSLLHFLSPPLSEWMAFVLERAERRRERRGVGEGEREDVLAENEYQEFADWSEYFSCLSLLHSWGEQACSSLLSLRKLRETKRGLVSEFLTAPSQYGLASDSGGKTSARENTENALGVLSEEEIWFCQGLAEKALTASLHLLSRGSTWLVLPSVPPFIVDLDNSYQRGPHRMNNEPWMLVSARAFVFSPASQLLPLSLDSLSPSLCSALSSSLLASSSLTPSLVQAMRIEVTCDPSSVDPAQVELRFCCTDWKGEESGQGGEAANGVKGWEILALLLSKGVKGELAGFEPGTSLRFTKLTASYCAREAELDLAQDESLDDSFISNFAFLRLVDECPEFFREFARLCCLPDLALRCMRVILAMNRPELGRVSNWKLVDCLTECINGDANVGMNAEFEEDDSEQEGIRALSPLFSSMQLKEFMLSVRQLVVDSLE